MTRQRFRVGIVGLQPDRGWATRAHVPALRALPDDFEIAGVANSNKESSERAAAAAGIPRAFAGVSELVTSPEIDIITIAVRVPYHLEIAQAAIEAGKHVYCEWPLARDLAEAETMAVLARRKNVLGIVGTQAPLAPEVQFLKGLVAEGFAGSILSATLVGRGGPLQGSGTIPDVRDHAYLLDRSNGATLLTIPVGHTLAALTSVLGPIAEVSAVLATRRPTALVIETGESLPATAPDEVLVSGLLGDGAPFSIHYRGGSSRDAHGFCWEIHGSDGDIRVSGPSGHAQMVQLSLAGARGEEKLFRQLEVPRSFRSGWPAEVGPGNVARLYARMAHDLRHGTRSAPDFEDAVALHRVITAIEKAAESGIRTSVESLGPAA